MSASRRFQIWSVVVLAGCAQKQPAPAVEAVVPPWEAMDPGFKGCEGG